MQKSNKLLQNKTVAIIGGGPGGLTLSRLLQMRGVNVTLFERDTSPAARVQGTCLDLHEESGRRAMKACGLTDEFLRSARAEGDRHLVMNKNGKIKLDLPPMKFVTPDPEVDRGDLRNIFLSSLNPDSVQWNRRLVSLQKNNDGRFDLEFENNERVTADVVIGCDGVRSKIRPYVTPLKPKYSGITWVEAEIDNSHPNFQKIHQMIDGGSLFVFGDEKALLLQEKSDGHTMVYFTGRVLESEIADLVKTVGKPDSAQLYFEKFIDQWNPVFKDVIKSLNGRYAVRPIESSDPGQSWETKDGVTLIGDAAHVMPPFAGQGANMAMLDAVILADALTDGKSETVKDALRAYETEMFKRTAAAMQQTHSNEDIFYQKNADDLLIKKMLGRFSLLTPVIPHVVRLVNTFFGFYTSLIKRTPTT